MEMRIFEINLRLVTRSRASRDSYVEERQGVQEQGTCRQAGRQAGRQTEVFGRTILDKKLFTLGAIGLHMFSYCFEACLGIIVGTCW